MPWTTPTLTQVRSMTRDAVAGYLATATIPKQVLLSTLNNAATVGNSVLRVMSDVMAGLGSLTLKYVDWATQQMLPDTAETIFLDRHGIIWLQNSDGSKGRKASAAASGYANFTGQPGVIVPAGTIVNDTNNYQYQTTAQIILGSLPTQAPIIALDPGAQGNLPGGSILAMPDIINGVNGSATVVTMAGGADPETDDELRARILQRIQEPPAGGDKTDWEAWALEVPGVTRAWCSPLEQGPGTVTLRFTEDDLRSDLAGIPTADDVERVSAWIDTKRPVAVKDTFVVAPIPFPINLYITGLVTDNSSTRQAIVNALQSMFYIRAIPGGTMYRSWIDAAISDAVGEDHHELTYTTTVMPTPGHLPILGSIIYAGG